MRSNLNKPSTGNTSTSPLASRSHHAFSKIDINFHNDQALGEIAALADELISMENQTHILESPAPIVIETTHTSSAEITKKIKLLQSRKENEIKLLSDAAKKRGTCSISMEKFQSQILKRELELQKLAESESTNKIETSNRTSKSTTFEVDTVYVPSADDAIKIAELKTKIADLQQLEIALQTKKNCLQEVEKINKASTKKFLETLNSVIAARKKLEGNLDWQLTTLKISDAIDYKDIEQGIRESGIAQKVDCLLENPEESDKNKLFQGFLDRFSALIILEDGTSKRIHAEEFKGNSAAFFHTMMSLVSFLPSTKYLESLMEGVGGSGVKLLKKFPSLGDEPPTPNEMIAMSRIVYPAFESFLKTIRDDHALIAAVKDSAVNTKIRIDGTKITKAKANQVYHPQYAAVVALIDSDIETLFDGFFMQCLYWHDQFSKKFANALELIKHHQSELAKVKSQYQKLLGECVMSEHEIKEVNAEIKRISAESCSLAKDHEALCKPSKFSVGDSVSEEASAALGSNIFSNASIASTKAMRNADNDTKRQRLIGQISTLVSQHQQDGDDYEIASQQHLTAAAKLQETEVELIQLNAQLSAVKIRRLEEMQDQQLMDLERRNNIQTLREKIASITSAITANESVGQSVLQLISAQALSRLLERHLDQQDQHLVERAKSTGRAATYQSFGCLLKSLVAVYQSAKKRFPQVLCAKTANDFAITAARVGMVEDRLCNHEEVVGRGFRATQMRDDAPIKSSVTCYTLAWCKEARRVVISHAFPWVAYQ